MKGSLVERFSRLLTSKTRRGVAELWQDREIRFDLGTALLKPRRGESVIASLENVEDAKGRRYEIGYLYLTTLRLVWSSTKRKRFNISIGHHCITELRYEELQTRLQGLQRGLGVARAHWGLNAIHVVTRYGSSAFQFVFTSYEGDTAETFERLQRTLELYRKTRLHRDLAIRDLLVKGSALLLLEGEDVVDRLEPVANLLCEAANAGVLYITNLRVVWSSTAHRDLNVSIPYLQLYGVKVRDSKFGKALVMETTERSGGYVLGFRLEPESELERLQKQIRSLQDAFEHSPQFGVPSENPTEFPAASTDDETDAGEDEMKDDVLALYGAGDEGDREALPVFNATLGLAVEPLRGDITVEDLWNTI